MYRRKGAESLPAPIGVAESRKFKPFRIDSSNYQKAFAWPGSSRIRWRLLALLMAIWAVTVHYHERVHVYSTIRKCQWNKWEQWPAGSPPHRAALIADPQIVDAYSYTSGSFITYFVKKISDNYLYRNNKIVQAYLDPDTTIFLGDLFDGGREWKNDVWFEEYQRFNKIFPKKINRRTVQSLPGNHDIGFQTIHKDVVTRFSTFFGEPNDYLIIGNHSIVMLDTISLSSPDETISFEATQFLNTVNSRLNPQFPRILLTHVPLYRNKEQQLCGPLRESKKLFPVQKGKQYQTVIEYEISQTVLEVIHPDIIFAGDDHDYCDIRQPYTSNGVERVAREIAVKSAAMTSGIKYPAIQLLSLHNPYDPNPHREPKETYQTSMCYMPSPYYAIYSYVLLLLFTIGYLAFVFFPSIGNLNLRSSVLPSYAWLPRKDDNRSMSSFILHFGLILVMIYALFAIYFVGI
ncbi:Cell division control protein 1 [Meyerozyma sp. JA9]|nr:Cell division control protein 1 [Meyerozyma sp. JA9]